MIKKDLWKGYVLGDSSLSFEKPADIHDLTKADRWRKYANNVIEENYSERYVEEFARYWCHEYNDDQGGETLERFTIYGLWQRTLPLYQRGEVQKKSLWQHCCLKDGCFASTPSTTPIVPAVTTPVAAPATPQ